MHTKKAKCISCFITIYSLQGSHVFTSVSGDSCQVGVLNSSRMAKYHHKFFCRRKKFESPQQPTANTDNPFSARGAIRRLSLRDRSGMTLARMEAQKEQTDLLRSWSKEDVSFSKVWLLCWCSLRHVHGISVKKLF